MIKWSVLLEDIPKALSAEIIEKNVLSINELNKERKNLEKLLNNILIFEESGVF